MVVVVGLEVEVDALGSPLHWDYLDALGGDEGGEVDLDEGLVGFGVGVEKGGGGVLGPGAHVAAVVEVEGLEPGGGAGGYGEFVDF